MCEFSFSPLLNYYTHIPVFVISLLIGFFIYLSNKKNAVNRNIFIFILFFCLWIINDLLQWIVVDPVINLFMARISIIEVTALTFFLLAVFAFVGKKVTQKIRFFLLLVNLPLFFLMFTNYNASLSDHIKCNVQFGPLYLYIYCIAFGILFYSIYLLSQHYRKENTTNTVKNQIKIIAGGFGFFILWFVVIASVTSYLVKIDHVLGDSLMFYVPFGMVVFIGLLAYAITKYQFLNIRSIAAQLLTYTIWILIGTQYFFVHSLLNAMLVTFTFILSVIFGSMLIYAIKTEIRQKRELEIANKKLLEMDRVKSEFISITSHQLRTPLTTMKGFIGVIKNGSYGKLPQNFEEPIDIMETANERLILLVEEMLSVSQIESGKMAFDFKEENINELIDELGDSFRIAVKNRGLVLTIKKSARLPSVRMDYGKMRETLSNIIDNAIKYTNQGEILICTRRCKEKFVIVSIKDTGIGITKNEQEHLFEKFVRGERARELKKSGVGLGLYLGKKIIEAHHGHIYAHANTDGPGATFFVKIPLYKK